MSSKLKPDGPKARREQYYVKVAHMYYKEGTNINQISKILSISRMTIQRWIRKFAEENDLDPTMKGRPKNFKKNISDKIREEHQSAMAESDKDYEIQQLKLRLKELEDELAEARMRVDIADKMIDIAEARFKIDIRKKHGAK